MRKSGAASESGKVVTDLPKLGAIAPILGAVMLAQCIQAINWGDETAQCRGRVIAPFTPLSGQIEDGGMIRSARMLEQITG